ncbi:2630_t:CDS:2 [Diversispora eburnea]|uniref:2630_t:CDS:1 n=1 Tax=Diversispora eburnea TaxID=1213867 RepID=A0A9N8W9I1_9GLOM|nr:2630_t:CDS:2 [Diversispora eburnea]
MISEKGKSIPSSLIKLIDKSHFLKDTKCYSGEFLAAFDINTIANSIYRSNFEKTDIWLMSPPCQPYTRTGRLQGSKDNRSKSFIYLIGLLDKMKNPPKWILIENVKGFEESDTRNTLIKQLNNCNYNYQEFFITPLQLGIPNSRLRYYLLAKKKPLTFKESDSSKILCHIPCSPYDQPFVDIREEEEGKGTEKQDLKNIKLEEKKDDNEIDQLDNNITLNHDNIKMKDNTSSPSPYNNKQINDNNNKIEIKFIKEYLQNEDDLNEDKKYNISDKILIKYGKLFDIVKPSLKRSCCFTKGYYHYVEATGSILQLNEELNANEIFHKVSPLTNKNNNNNNSSPPQSQEEIISSLRLLKLRYFTEYEISSIMGFPKEFSFSPEITLKQRYKVLGNSINKLETLDSRVPKI